MNNNSSNMLLNSVKVDVSGCGTFYIRQESLNTLLNFLSSNKAILIQPENYNKSFNGQQLINESR